MKRGRRIGTVGVAVVMFALVWMATGARAQEEPVGPADFAVEPQTEFMPPMDGPGGTPVAMMAQRDREMPGGPGEMGGPGGPGMPGGPMGPEGQGRPMNMPRVSDKEILATMNQLKTDDPQMYEDLTQLKTRDPQRFRMQITQMVMRDRDMKRMEKNDPEAYKTLTQIRKLEGQERATARKYRETDSDAEKALILKDLKSVADDLFDLNLRMRQKEIEMLQKQIDRVKQDIANRKKNKSAIIQKHIDDITGKNDTLRW